MNKERQVIEPGTIVFFNRNVEGKELEALSGKSLTVVIKGDLFLKGDFHFNGDMYIEGNIDGNKNIDIDGDLGCSGKVNLRDMCVKGDLKTYDYLQVQHILVEGNFYADSNIDSCKIKVGECFWAEEVDSHEVFVGGDFCCGVVNTNGFDLSVAGDFESNDGVIADFINVLGKMYVTGTIKANEIQVGY